MIVSHSRKFIFIHIDKCAGTSITRALLPHLDLEGGDIVMGCTPELEDLSNQNRLEGKPLWKHSRGMPIRWAVGEAVWNRYFKFAIVRNPWDRAVSLYFHRRNAKWDDEQKTNERIRRLGSFQRYVRSTQFPLTPMVQWIDDPQGRVMVDFVGRFENLETDFATVCDVVGIDRISLQRRNPSRHRHYRWYYTPRAWQCVRQVHREDIRRFGYHF